MDLPRLTLPATREHTHTIIFLHDRGDTARNVNDVLTYTTDSRDWSLVQNYPSFRWVFPSPPERVSPDSEQAALRSHWFAADMGIRETKDGAVNIDGLRVSVMGLKRVVVDEARRLNWQWDKIILAGIGQGAGTALYTLLTLAIDDIDMPADSISDMKRLGAVIGFSSEMPLLHSSLAGLRSSLSLGSVPADEIFLRGTPILLQHAADDPVIEVSKAHALRDTLQGWGATLTWKEYPKGGHWLNSPQGMDDVLEFILEVLGVKTPNIAKLSQMSGRGLVHAGFR